MILKKWFHAFLKMVSFSILIGTSLYTHVSVAATNPDRWQIPDLASMVKNLAEELPDLMQFITALAYVMGMFFIVEGILKLKKYGENRASGMSEGANLKSPLLYLGVGGALLYLPSSVLVGLSTFWTEANPYGYVSDTKDPWDQLIQSIFVIVQLIGTIAFIRGLIILSHMGGQGSQPGTFGKAMAHIVGGILCINIYEFIQAIANTLGLGQI